MPGETASNTDQKTILLVDDEQAIRSFVSNLLINSGYDVIVAESGEEALRLSREHKRPIHLLLSNIQMRGMTGVDLAGKITRERNEVRVMLMSGFTDGMLVLNEGWHFLHKPFVPSQLRGLIKSIMEQPPIPNLDEH